MKMQFGFTAVQSGQKSSTVNAEPRLIANSTIGKFVVTSIVSKTLGVAVGENIQFLNNINEVENAINTRHEAIVAWATENGVDLDTREGQEAALKVFSVWAIAKGIAQYNQKGEPVMGNIRYTKEEKLAAAVANIDDFIANEEIYTVVAKAMQDESFTKDQLLEVIASTEDNEYVNAVKEAVVSCVQSPQYHVHSGSKTATTGSSTGVGCQLNFTDTSIWNKIKNDLGNDKDLVNRNFKVVIENGFETEVHDGQKIVKIMAYPIEFINDIEPIRRGEVE